MELALALVEAVRAVDGVAGLHRGRFREVALLYPRRRVPGLRLTPGPDPRLEVHVIADLSRRRPLPELAEAVRGVAHAHPVELPVDVVIADAVDTTRAGA